MCFRIDGKFTCALKTQGLFILKKFPIYLQACCKHKTTNKINKAIMTKKRKEKINPTSLGMSKKKTSWGQNNMLPLFQPYSGWKQGGMATRWVLSNRSIKQKKPYLELKQWLFLPHSGWKHKHGYKVSVTENMRQKKKRAKMASFRLEMRGMPTRWVSNIENMEQK